MGNEKESSKELEQEVEIYKEEQQETLEEVSLRIPETLLPSSNNGNFLGLTQTVEALEHMNRLAEVLIKSSICPLKKPADVIVAIITGNQYGLPFMTSINNIFPINGKPTLSVHLQRAMILKAKVMFKKLLDYEPIYEYAKIDNEGKLVPKIVNGQTTHHSLGMFMKQDKPLENCVAVREVDRITKYEFNRLIKLEDGSFERLTIHSEFKMSDANTAGLLTKDVWRAYPARMLDARAFAIGSREIASDVTLGISSLGELAEVYNVPYTMTSGFEETPVLK